MRIVIGIVVILFGLLVVGSLMGPSRPSQEAFLRCTATYEPHTEAYRRCFALRPKLPGER